MEGTLNYYIIALYERLFVLRKKISPSPFDRVLFTSFVFLAPGIYARLQQRVEY